MSDSTDFDAAIAPLRTQYVGQLTMLRQGLTESNAQKDAAIESVKAHLATIATLHDEIDRLNAVIAGGPAPDPPPPVPDPDPLPPPTTKPKVFIGACPSGGSANAVVTKFGPSAAVRTFSPNGFAAPARPAGAGQWHHSWKPTLGTMLTDAQIIAALKPFQDGDIVTVWHETPVKIRNGSLSAASGVQALDMMNQFHASVVRLRAAGQIAKVQTCFVDSAWMWDSASLYPGSTTDPKSAAYWGAKVHADLVGVDMDAYGGGTGGSSYPDFIKVAQRVVAFVKANGFAGWTVPEFAHPRIASDSNGTARTAWIKKTYQAMLDMDITPEMIAWFDLEWSGSKSLVLQPGWPELAAIKAFV